MLHLPRQASSAGGAASSNDAASATSVNAASGSVSPTGSQTSAADSASAPVSSASSSTSADLTTTTSSTTHTTASTSSSPSALPSSNTISSTTSHAASSPSTASQTTSSATSSITTQPPTSSSSQQETTTTIASAYTTYVNGSQILTSTSFPSTIPAPELSSTSSSGDRTAIIAGSAAGGTAFIILILTFAFCIRRNRFKRIHFLDAITLRKRQARSRATFLDGEDLDSVGQPPRAYTDYETPWNGNDRALMMGGLPLDTPAPTLRSRWADTGSVFREEVWPPPNEATRLMDPFANRNDINIDLSRIVDDVMGPSHTRSHFSNQSVSSMHRGSIVDSQGAHSRTASNASHAALLEAAGLGGSASTAPVRPSPLAQQETKPPSVEDRGGGT